MKDRTNVGISAKMRYFMAALMIVNILDKAISSKIWSDFYEPFYTEATCVTMAVCALLILFGPWKTTDAAISIAGIGIGLNLILSFADTAISMDSDFLEYLVCFVFVVDGILIVYSAARFGMKYRRNGLRLAIFSSIPLVLYAVFTLYMIFTQGVTLETLANKFKLTVSMMVLYLIFVATILSPNVKLPNSEKKIRRHVEILKEQYYTEPDFYVTSEQAKEFVEAMKGNGRWEPFDDGIFSESYSLILHKGPKIKTLIFRKYAATGKIRVYAGTKLRFDYVGCAIREGDEKYENLAIFGEDGVFVNVLVSKNTKEEFDENCFTTKQKIMKKLGLAKKRGIED